MRTIAFSFMILAFVLQTVFFSACQIIPAGVTSSTLPVTSRDSYTIMDENVSGSDWAIGLLGMAIMPYSAYNAIQKVKEIHGADGLINVTAENKIFWVTLVYPLITYHEIRVSGDAISFKRGESEE